MKKLIIITASITLLLSGLAFSQTYKATTPDNTVGSKEQVQVEETASVTQKTTYTLSYINTRIAVLQAQVAEIQAEITELETLKAVVTIEAEKVKLKPPEVIE
ncbi:hypothetical protein LCGC14_1165120 [marine sediment metagenome]|uniref:Uncharacterized protein n=1 Tax=marine sediment metagenome TaxID=412755 RepID=A0A0F9LRK4_9ZZZZ